MVDDLAQLALKHDSDKNFQHTGYVQYYEKYFSPLRDKPVRLLELGMYCGNSIRMWEEYFPTGHILGVDIMLYNECKYDFKRARFCIGYLQDAVFVQEMATNNAPFDIIIDDAGHFPDQQRLCLYTLFPHLDPKGIYVIEDLHTSYMEKFCGGYNREDTIIDEIKKLVNHMHHNYLANNLKLRVPKLGTNEIFDDHLEAIHVYPNICFLMKR